MGDRAEDSMGNPDKFQTESRTAVAGHEAGDAPPFSAQVQFSGTNGSAAATDLPKLEIRHAALIRVTHWLTTLAFLALLVTGVEILISHPRFYWGETGNVHTRPLFTLRIPSSRGTVPTGYGYVLPDQNGWSRYLLAAAPRASVTTSRIALMMASCGIVPWLALGKTIWRP